MQVLCEFITHLIPHGRQFHYHKYFDYLYNYVQIKENRQFFLKRVPNRDTERKNIIIFF